MNSQTKNLVITAGTPAEETPASSQKAKTPAYDRMNVLCVPIEALGMDSEDGSGSTQPETGDEVEVSVTGLVNRIQNGQAYIVVASVNDAPVTKAQTENPDDADATDGADESDPNLDDLAKQADESGLL